MAPIKLYASMIGTLALIISISTLALAFILSLAGALNVFTLFALVLGFNLLQWLFAPKLIDALYGVKEMVSSKYPALHSKLRTICVRSGLAVPKLMLAKIPIPNAFAYGSPLYGTRVAVTEGLLKTLEDEEVEAVLGHELGHLKHKDVQLMTFISALPAIFYYLGYSLLWSRRRDERDATPLIGLVAIVVYWLLTMAVLGLSRLREYYADQHGVRYVPDGARKLSEGLAKIASSSRNLHGGHHLASLNSFKTLFISDPDRAETDLARLALRGVIESDSQLVHEIVNRKVSLLDQMMELFSTHPNIVKRLKALQ